VLHPLMAASETQSKIITTTTAKTNDERKLAKNINDESTTKDEPRMNELQRTSGEPQMDAKPRKNQLRVYSSFYRLVA
jgi:hypothetical protein